MWVSGCDKHTSRCCCSCTDWHSLIHKQQQQEQHRLTSPGQTLAQERNRNCVVHFVWALFFLPSSSLLLLLLSRERSLSVVDCTVAQNTLSHRPFANQQQKTKRNEIEVTDKNQRRRRRRRKRREWEPFGLHANMIQQLTHTATDLTATCVTHRKGKEGKMFLCFFFFCRESFQRKCLSFSPSLSLGMSSLSML